MASSEPATLACGAVVTRTTPQGVRFLLLRAFAYWDFPKGEREDDEPPQRTALREVREETGLDDVRLLGDDYHETEPYRRGKVARYYLARTEQETVRLPVSPELGRPEHHEARWCDADEAAELLGTRVRAALDWARRRLDV